METAHTDASNKSSIDHLMQDGQPLWDAIEFDVLCSRCDYNLRLLPNPRCPECGLEFDWNIVLNEHAWRSDYLFEHHWRIRPFNSWMKTMRRSLRPIKFWKNVSIHDRIHPGPLWFLLLTSVLWWSVTFHGLAWIGAKVTQAILSYASGTPPGVFKNSLLNRLARSFSLVAGDAFDEDGLCVAAVMLLTVVGAFLLICTLRQTLGRCRVRLTQILRVVAYMSSPFLLLAALISIGYITVEVALSVREGLEIALGLCMAISLIALFGFYIGAGLRHYLRLPHAYATGAIAVFTGTLFGITVLALVFIGW